MQNVDFSCVGTLIQKLRTENNLTLQELAEEMHVSKAAVSQWEKGEGIKTEKMYDLAKFFEITVSELINGKLDNENNHAFFERNYNLSDYDFDEMIDDSNVERLKDLFTHCAMVKKKFFEMLLPWAKDELPPGKTEEFLALRKYFEPIGNFNVSLAQGLGIDLPQYRKEEKDLILAAYEQNKNADADEYNWQMSKLYHFVFDIKSDKICESRNLKALEYMLGVMSQPERDGLLETNLHRKMTVEKERDSFLGTEKTKVTEWITKDYTLSEIEDIPYFRVMLNNGCHCMYRDFNTMGSIEEDDLDRMEGNPSLYEDGADEIVKKTKKNSCFYRDDELFAVKNWRELSLDEYLSFVDYEHTEFLKAVVNYKDTEPLKYYECIEKTQGRYLN